VLKIDDPVGAVAVHMMNGIWGTLAVGLFATKSAPGFAIALESGAIKGQGLFYGGGFTQLGLQCVGMFSTIAWTVVMGTITFMVIKHTIGLRVSEEEELKGLDVTEHGLTSAYADFMPAGNMFYSAGTMPVPKSGLTPVIEKSTEHKPALKPVAASKTGDMTEKFTKISIICQQNKFDELKEAMNQIGVNGLTVTQVMGCGVQKGISTTYRGAELSVMLIPKVKVEVVVSAVPIETVIETAKSVLYTGNIGDGKIFVYDVENVVKVRTGEEGFDALQDTTA
jgi:Amt family ammonium transporter